MVAYDRYADYVVINEAIQNGKWEAADETPSYVALNNSIARWSFLYSINGVVYRSPAFGAET
jgi:hypothetical protein